MSAVLVVVIDWTLTGKSLPTPTPPTSSCRVLRRGARTGGGAAGMPRLTVIAMTPSIPCAPPDAGGAAVTCAHGTRRDRRGTGLFRHCPTYCPEFGRSSCRERV